MSLEEGLGAQYRVHEIMPCLLIPQLNNESIFEKEHEAVDFVYNIQIIFAERMLEVFFYNSSQANFDTPFKNYPDHPQRRAAQRIRILAPRRLFVDRPKPDQRVDLIRQRDRNRHRIVGHTIVRPLRLVMLLAGGGDGRVLALRLRIVFTHEPLQLRELADHFGQQVSLGELRRALGLVDVGTDQRRDLGSQPFDTRDAFGLRAKLFVEHDGLELRQTILQTRLQVGLVEELRVRQAGADHALVAADDGLAAVGGFDIRREDELVGELARPGIADDEAFLVFADGGADHFAGDRQEVLFERPHQHHGPFDEARDLVQQVLVLDQLKTLRKGELPCV